jgi:hypothetical protein
MPAAAPVFADRTTRPGVWTAATVPGRIFAEPTSPTAASLDPGSPAAGVAHGPTVTGVHGRATSADGAHDPAGTVDRESALPGSVPVPAWTPTAEVPATARTAPVAPLVVLPAAAPEVP